MKYAYIFNYREMDQQLFTLECKQLFGVEVTEKVLISDVDVSSEHSPFMHEKMTILACSNHPDGLVEEVEKLQLESDVYKVIFLGKRTNVEYELQLSLCRRCGNAIEGDFSLYEPKILYGILHHHGMWYFGVAEKMEKRWLKHQNKPHSYTYSLPARLARIAISLAGKNDRSRTLIDPCCGVGTVVLEGLHLGYDIKGIEMNPPIASDANKNCAYYGYPEAVTCMDMTLSDEHADCAILDIPYGVMENADDLTQKKLLAGCRKMADELVLFSVDPMKEMLEETGWILEAQVPFVKQQFVRYITVCRGQNQQK